MAAADPGMNGCRTVSAMRRPSQATYIMEKKRASSEASCEAEAEAGGCVGAREISFLRFCMRLLSFHGSVTVKYLSISV